MFYDILKFFPNNIWNFIKSELNKENIIELEEVRIRNNKNIILKFNNYEKILEHRITSKEIIEILQIICENSIYSYQKEIGQGYITVKGGHRVGISRKLCYRKPGK